MTTERVWRQEGSTLGGARDEEDIVASAKKAYDDRRIAASKTPSRKDRERQRVPVDTTAASRTPSLPPEQQRQVTDDPSRPEEFNASSLNAAARANAGPFDDVAKAKQEMDQKKRDAWLKTPKRKDRARASGTNVGRGRVGF